MAIDYEVTALDAGARVTVSSELRMPAETAAEGDDPRRGKGFAERPLDVVAAETAGPRVVLSLATRRSGLALACGMHNEFAGADSVETTVASSVAQAELEAGGTLRLRKYVAYHWADSAPAGELGARAHRTLDRAQRDGYDAIEAAHARHVEAFWSRSDVVIDGAPDVRRAVRFNLFQLMQATARAEGHGVPPLPVRYYLPPDDVRRDLLRPSDTKTLCAYKGQASYWSLEGENDLAWSYPEPLRDAAEVTDRLALFNERVDIIVDGTWLERPVTPWSPR